MVVLHLRRNPRVLWQAMLKPMGSLVKLISEFFYLFIYSQALLARKLQAMIGYPSMRNFLQIIDHQLLLNCPITRADILAAKDILGLNVHSLKGKTVQWTAPHVSSSITPVLSDILSLYHSVTLCMDNMFVNKMPFLVTISHNIKFGTAELLLN